MSLRDIGTIIRRHLGEEEVATADKSLSLTARAFNLFKKSKNLVNTAIAINLDTLNTLCGGEL